MYEGEGREKETQNWKQAPGSELPAQSLIKGLNSWTIDHDLSRSQMFNRLSHPGASIKTLKKKSLTSKNYPFCTDVEKQQNYTRRKSPTGCSRLSFSIGNSTSFLSSLDLAMKRQERRKLLGNHRKMKSEMQELSQFFIDKNCINNNNVWVLQYSAQP